MYETLALYIDGEFLSGEGRNTEEVTNPATLDVLGQLPHASTADLDRALAAAALAFESWRHSSPMQRSEILRKVGQLSRERARSEEHTSELQSLMRISYAVFCLKKKKKPS